jgi:hypothetical protein
MSTSLKFFFLLNIQSFSKYKNQDFNLNFISKHISGGIRIAHHALLNMKHKRDIKIPPLLLAELNLKDVDVNKQRNKVFFTSLATVSSCFFVGFPRVANVREQFSNL